MKTTIIIVDDLGDLSPREISKLSEFDEIRDLGAVPVFEAKGLTDFSVLRNTYTPDIILLMAPKLAEKIYYLESIEGILNSIRIEQGPKPTTIVILPKPADIEWSSKG